MESLLMLWHSNRLPPADAAVWIGEHSDAFMSLVLALCGGLIAFATLVLFMGAQDSLNSMMPFHAFSAILAGAFSTGGVNTLVAMQAKRCAWRRYFDSQQ